MTSENLTLYPIRTHKAAAVILTILSGLIGYVTAMWVFPARSNNTVLIALLFMGVPFCLAVGGVLIGSAAKNAIEYNPPEWRFAPHAMRPMEAKQLAGAYMRKYARLAPNGHFVAFYAPILLLLAAVGVPLYTSQIDPGLEGLMPITLGILFALLALSSVLLGFLATSNAASRDFTLPPIREAVWVAQLQEGIRGISGVEIVFDRAEADGLVRYSGPRVVARVHPIEEDAYIQTWSDEKGAVTSIMCRLEGIDDRPSVTWWWLSRDRSFRKYVGADRNGYYVRYPVPSDFRELGVKDVRLLTENAVAILLLEWLRSREGREGIHEILRALGVDPPDSRKD